MNPKYTRIVVFIYSSSNPDAWDGVCDSSIFSVSCVDPFYYDIDVLSKFHVAGMPRSLTENRCNH